MNRDAALPFILPFIRWADVVTLTQRRSVEQRRIYDHELVYVVAGRGRIVINNVAHEAIPDRLFFVQPRVWHSFVPEAGEVLQLLGVHFDWTPQHDTLAFPIFSPADEPVEESKFRTPREIPHWPLGAQPFLELCGRLAVRRALEAVVAEYSRLNRDELAREAAGALLSHTIFVIAREAKALQQMAQSTRIGADALRRVQHARELLESTPAAPHSVDEVATQVGWSADHLRRTFKQVLGTSPQQFQMTARLRHAQEMLRKETLSISEVAHHCGFDDPSHFARVFKTHTGLTPRQYLQMAKGY